MHVGLVKSWYPPHTGYGGVATYHYHLAWGLASLGHRVTVVAARYTSDVPALDDEGRVQVLRILLRPRHRLHRMPVLGRFLRSFRELGYSARVAVKLRELEATKSLDVIEFPEVGAEAFVYLLRKTRRPVVVRCHTPTFVLKRYYTEAEMPFDTRLTSAMEKYCIRHADALTAPSHDMARCVARECRFPVEPVTVIPNALQVNHFHTPRLPGKHDHVTVLHVGRLERVKGIETLARAIPLLLDSNRRLRFVLVGEDRPDGAGSSWWARLEAQLASYRSDGRLEYLGVLDQRALSESYCRADIVVVPSMLYESFSYTCAQAMSAGIPVVATRIGGIPETVLDGESGILVEPGAVDELVRAILTLAADPDLRRRMGEAGRRRASTHFDAVRVAARTVELYRSVIERFGDGAERRHD